LVDRDYATVMVHADRQGPTGGAIIDVYRLKDGKIVEHWDVNEIIPAKAANPHPFF
jgi:predicted SnoaL-like aldol condensation-catalyzing enzyme